MMYGSSIPNGHAYKRGHCETRDDAIVQAIEEKAHLVVINNAEEQVWVVNPVNEHAYKRIYCHDVMDAMTQAAMEGAYLVSINNEAEDVWIHRIFEPPDSFWIGLSDVAEEGQWVWQSGEPLTYENWGSKYKFPRSILSPEEKDSAVMTFVNGQWHAVGPGDLLWRMTKMAILEKADIFDNFPAQEK